jgi:hypothetical protein
MRTIGLKMIMNFDFILLYAIAGRFDYGGIQQAQFVSGSS